MKKTQITHNKIPFIIESEIESFINENSDFLNGIKRTIYGLIKNHDGYFKSDKQRDLLINFLKSQEGLFDHKISKYNSAPVFATYDEKGISGVYVQRSLKTGNKIDYIFKRMNDEEKAQVSKSQNEKFLKKQLKDYVTTSDLGFARKLSNIDSLIIEIPEISVYDNRTDEANSIRHEIEKGKNSHNEIYPNILASLETIPNDKKRNETKNLILTNFKSGLEIYIKRIQPEIEALEDQYQRNSNMDGIEPGSKDYEIVETYLNNLRTSIAALSNKKEDIINLQKELNNINSLSEEVNFHYGDFASKDKDKPEYSDNIFIMSGRDTGHFGSGVYFSTYSEDDELDKHRYGRESLNKNVTTINNGLVMLDLENVPNMFRVRNARIAEHLFKTLKSINSSFYRIYYSLEDEKRKGKSIKEAFDSIKGEYIGVYRMIRYRFKELGVDVPNITEFAKELYTGIEDYSKRFNQEGVSRLGSMSTRIMTLLGFSGVDVSRVKGWDNTTHGSVVYDIYNIGDLIQKVDTNNIKTPDEEHGRYINSLYKLEDMSYDKLKTLFSQLNDLSISFNKYGLMSKKVRQVYNAEMIKRLKNMDSWGVDLRDMDNPFFVLFQDYIPDLPMNDFSKIVYYEDKLGRGNILRFIKRLIDSNKYDPEDIKYDFGYYLKGKGVISDEEYYNTTAEELIPIVQQRI